MTERQSIGPDKELGSLRLRPRELNERHAHVSVYQGGGLAGTLIIDREAWDALHLFAAKENERS